MSIANRVNSIKERVRDNMRAYHIRQHYKGLKKQRYYPAYYQIADMQKRGV